MVGVGYGAVNFRMEGADWSSGEDPVDDSFALEKGMRGRGWRVVILKCVERVTSRFRSPANTMGASNR
jgi:hypothetical protein